MVDESISDAELIAATGESVGVPRRDPADSFVLHAPLELAARAALLPHVAPPARDAARQRLRDLADRYERAGPPVADPVARAFDSPAAAAARLGEVVEAGDLDEVDAVASWLGRHASPTTLRALLAEPLVPRLSAAAHAPIFLYQLPRVSPRGEVSPTLLRPLVRELARHPTWRLHWYEEERQGAGDAAPPPDALWDALAATPRLGIPGSDFIFPVMSQVDAPEIAGAVLRDALAGLDPHAGARTIMRAAARSMLDEPPDFAPYGWSHCLTLPQAVLGIADACADPVVPLAVAATFVVGFRAAMSTCELHPDEPVGAPPETVTDLVTYAATHEDAHLVKYTLACLDAAASDRPRAGLYLSAAARLGRWWRDHGSQPTAA